MEHQTAKPQRGLIVSFTGPSGSGKTTIVGELLNDSHTFEIIPSITTRAPRPSDIPGEYHYVRKIDFFEMKNAGEFLWDVKAHGNYYGTRRHDIDTALSLPKISLILLVPDVLRILSSYTDRVVPYFITVRDENILRERLSLRGEDESDILRRVEDCVKWEAEARDSDIRYTFFNNEGAVKETAREIYEAIIVELAIRNEL